MFDADWIEQGKTAFNKSYKHEDAKFFMLGTSNIID